MFGDLRGNRMLVADSIRSAAAAGAELVVLPELCTTGYRFEDESQARELAEAAHGPTVSEWRRLAAELQVGIVAGFCELEPGGAPFNSAAVVDPNGLCHVYRKTHLWDREQLIFRAGSAPAPVLATSFGRLGVAICYDAFFPEVMRGLALAGADMIAVPMNTPLLDAPTEPLGNEVVLALAAAAVNRVFVAQADRTGRERGTDWAEASVICDPAGRLLAAPRSGVATLQAACHLAAARDKSLGPRNDVLRDRRTELYLTRSTPEGKEIVH